MLCYKAWLETRWRFGFVVASILFVWLTPLWLPLLGMRLPPGPVGTKAIWVGIHVGSVLLYVLAAGILAGSGVNTQTTYGATTGFHGSMLFTLSLPVSRRQLLFVRAGLGALQTSVLVAIMAEFTLLQIPGGASVIQSISYIARAVACTMAIYALSTVLACLLDEMWQCSGVCLFCVALFLAQSRSDVIAQISPFRGMSLLSYRIAAPMPWAPVLASLLFAAALLYASMLILQRKEY